MRHGLAENEFDSDFNRALSTRGQAEALNVARQILAVEHPLPNHLLVSPFRRTQETARIVHKTLNLVEPYETDEMLVHFADHQLLGDYLLSLEQERVMIISHMPIVARLCQYLVPGCDVYGFQTAQVVKLVISDNNKANIEQQYLPST